MSPRQSATRCILALEDGTVFGGRAFGACGTAVGEVVFNTSMSGYQEILTDPSYCGQIVTLTYPLIGNYGINPQDVESAKPHVRGLVIKELAPLHSNYRATMSLEDYLAQHGIVGIDGIDTRALTKRLRQRGTMRGAITTEIHDPAECVRLAVEAPSMTGADLVRLVAPKACSTWTEGLSHAASPSAARGRGRWEVTVIDCGIKRNILRHLVEVGCSVRVVGPTTAVEELLDPKPDGVLIGNGPGDPAAVHYAIELLRGLVGRVPLFGICLGHQLLGLALGARTFKLKFGHRGANQPVRNMATGLVEITSQNHGFAIDIDSLERAGCTATHINLNDQTLEGFAHTELPIMAVQYHPEASPGPHDATYLFDCFVRMMDTGRPLTGDEMADASRHINGKEGLDRAADAETSWR